MLKILPLHPKINKLIRKYSLKNKFQKQLKLLSFNPKHPSLRCEYLKPKQYGILSFRIDKKFRALFIYRPDLKGIEILNITVHYH